MNPLNGEISKLSHENRKDETAVRLQIKSGESLILPQIPAAKQLTGIRSWTSFTDDTTTQSYSGSGVYTTSFTIKNKAADYLLQFDKLYERQE